MNIEDFLKKVESTNPPHKILVIGDSMLDENFSIKVKKINEEHPTRCFCSSTTEPNVVTPGGASNICYQGKHFNIDLHLFSLIDDYSKQVYDNTNINTSGCEIMKTGKVPLKRRFHDGDFPLDRWDIENESYGEPNIKYHKTQIKTKILAALDTSPKVVILSDYTKGLLTEDFSKFVIKECNKRNIITIVDPKTTNLKQWRNCTFFKPNANYVKTICNSTDREIFQQDFNGKKWFSQSKYIKEKLNCKNVIITDSGHGVYTSETEEYLTYAALSKKRPQIRSTAGGGDVFAFFLAMGICYNLSLKDSIYLAYNAATVYIQDKHNKPITLHNLHSWIDPIGAKKVTLQQLLKIKEQLTNQTFTMANGCMDLLHVAHMKTINFAKNCGDKLIIAINSDESVSRLKGSHRPIIPLQNRIEMIAALQDVDFVISFDEDTPYNLIEKIKPDVLVKGEEYIGKYIAGSDIVKEVKFAPHIEGLSTTKIIEKLSTHKKQEE